jgi:hypothetical protein
MNPVLPVVSVLLTMSVSVYTPGANTISGGDTTASGKRVHDLHAACGPAYPFGTVFEVVGPTAGLLREHGIATRVVCEDRGSAVGNAHLDIALVTGANDDRLQRAFAFGRQPAAVLVTLPDPVATDVCVAPRSSPEASKNTVTCQLRRARMSAR